MKKTIAEALANMNVQVRGVGHDEMKAYWDKWVGQRVQVHSTGEIHEVVHAQMLMGEQLKLDNGAWVAPWQVTVVSAE